MPYSRLPFFSSFSFTSFRNLAQVLVLNMSNVHITSLDKNLAPRLLVYSEAHGLLSDIDASSFAVETHMVILF